LTDYDYLRSSVYTLAEEFAKADTCK